MAKAKKTAKKAATKVTHDYRPINVGGRPPKFKTKQQMVDAINNYFASCWEPEYQRVLTTEGAKKKKEQLTEADYEVLQKTDIHGQPVYKQVRPYTITGLAIALDTTRDLLIDYGKKAEFSDTVRRAKQYIQNYTEEGFVTGKINPMAGQFLLKNNYGWKDKSEIEHDATDSLAALIATAHGNKRPGKDTQ